MTGETLRGMRVCEGKEFFGKCKLYREIGHFVVQKEQ